MAFRAKTPPQNEPGFNEIANRFKAHPFLFGGTVIVLVIVIVAFVFVPALPTIGGEDRDMIFGYYHGTPISFVPGNYFAGVLNEIAAARQFQLQSDYSQDSGLAYDVWYGAFIRTLVHVAILDEMKSAGYTAPPEEIDRQVAERPEFQEEGRFSVIKYRAFDKNRLLALWNSEKENHITRKYIDDLTGLRVSSAEKAFIGGMAFPERTFEAVFFPRSAYPAPELSAFAAANPEFFTNVHFSKITLASSEKEARQVLESVQSGRSTFEDAARNQSSDTYKDRGGDMGIRMAFEMFSEVSEEAGRKTLLSLNKGSLSPVLKVPSGWAFFRAEETPYSPDLTLEENTGKIRTYMNRFEGGRIENWLAARAEALIAEAQANNLSLAAYIAGLPGEDPASQFTVSTLGPVNLNYGNAELFRTVDTSGSPFLPQAVSNEHFWRTAFSLPLHTPSAPFTLGDSIAVLTVIEENTGDETGKKYVSDFYSQSWMYSALDSDLNYAFTGSRKFENKFYEVFLSFLFQTQP
ncbi:MAG: peptidylprolyl isomerase [Treponema sp.]|jgi:hypothetical protein|nr:peptidylprolyl isomerase [Treponema sp.]